MPFLFDDQTIQTFSVLSGTNRISTLSVQTSVMRSACTRIPVIIAAALLAESASSGPVTWLADLLGLANRAPSAPSLLKSILVISSHESDATTNAVIKKVTGIRQNIADTLMTVATSEESLKNFRKDASGYLAGYHDLPNQADEAANVLAILDLLDTELGKKSTQLQFDELNLKNHQKALDDYTRSTEFETWLDDALEQASSPRSVYRTLSAQFGVPEAAAIVQFHSQQRWWSSAREKVGANGVDDGLRKRFPSAYRARTSLATYGIPIPVSTFDEVAQSSATAKMI
uniref:Uncharacterized protein n=1 Tax=Hyaloperonospora arabidopsidis (strain Emoy2) TaxID=559515 RepID=M4BYU1_HYAAE